MKLFAPRRKQVVARRPQSSTLDRLSPAAIPSPKDYERALCNALASGKLPDDLVRAFASPENRTAVQAYLTAQRELDVAMAEMRTNASPQAALSLSACALRYAEAYSAVAKATFASRFDCSVDAS